MAMVSLLMTASAGAVAFAAWRWWRPAPVEVARVRSILDIDLPWRCDAGHSFTARGQMGDRPCGMCDQPAYPQATFDCPRHGSVQASVRFQRTPEGSISPSQMRFPGGDWRPMSDEPECPTCGAAMARQSTEARDAHAAGKKRPGG